MKYLTKYRLIVFLLTLGSLIACEDVIFLPAQGSIQGFVEDNNGVPLAGVPVSVTFEAPSQSGQAFPETQTLSTDANGFYRFTDIWDEVSFSINQPGFQSFTKLIDLGTDDDQALNVTLEGSPTILSFDISKTTLTTATQDTLHMNIEVLDVFNSQTGIYTGNILLQNASGATQAIVPATMTTASQQQFLLEAQITSNLLPVGTYTPIIEVIDPDNNSYQRKSGQQISVQ